MRKSFGIGLGFALVFGVGVAFSSPKLFFYKKKLERRENERKLELEEVLFRITMVSII